MSYRSLTHRACGSKASWVKDISEDEALCEKCGWVYLDECYEYDAYADPFHGERNERDEEVTNDQAQ